MNCQYKTLFFNIFAGIVQTFIESWNQLLYPRVIEVCSLRFQPRHDFFWHIVLNIRPSFGEFTALLQHISLIHNVTINGNNLFVNFRWTSIFALRNRMTERTSHLAGFWIGAAISSTSHSNKVGSTTVRRARLTGKGSNRLPCCHNKHNKFPYRPTRDVSLLSGQASYTGEQH